MNKQDKEYINMTARIVSTEIVEKYLEPIKEKVEKHDMVLNNGIKQSVDDLKETVKTYAKEKRQGKRKFWMTLTTGLIIGLLVTIVAAILTKIV